MPAELEASDSPETPSPRRRSSTPAVAWCLLIALAVAALTLVRFSPRFIYWRSLTAGHWIAGAETHRAFATFDQLADPWAPVTSPPNHVIAWRLLFPLTWHYLHLPIPLFLAMPYVGCLLALWLVAWLTWKRSSDWTETAVVTALSAAAPWFFVSTGWLTYFDSWLVISLLAAAFVPSRPVLVAACLLTPWIDERFVVGLPLTLTVRWSALVGSGELTAAEFRRDLIAVIAASLPYALLRAVAWFTSDPNSVEYIRYHTTEISSVPWRDFVDALWSGFRAGWPVLLATPVLAARRSGFRTGIALGLVLIVTALGGLVIAVDMSRTMVLELPVLILGLWLASEARPSLARRALPVLAALNLLLPAAHVLWLARVPIESLPAQIEAWRRPPAIFTAAHYVRLGDLARRNGNRAGALEVLDVALRLEPGYAPAYVGRGLVRLEARDLKAAEADAAEALRLAPDSPDALVLRAFALRSRGETARAVQDLERALLVAPPDWPQRAQIQDILKAAKGAASSN
jgi:hypothetical protein